MGATINSLGYVSIVDRTVNTSPQCTIMNTAFGVIGFHRLYRIAGYFHGVPIFVIFVTHRQVTKFSTHKIFNS